jgi:hypothetical protein
MVSAEMHAADRGDTATLPDTLASAARHLDAIEAAPSPAAPAEPVADKGCHSRETLKALDDGPWKTRIAGPKRCGLLRWHGDYAARRAVVDTRIRLLSGIARAAFKLRTEIVERCFALVLERGGMRRSWLRGRENIHKRHLIHVAGCNLGLLMRLLPGAGTAREFQARLAACLAALILPTGCPMLLIGIAGDQIAAFAVTFHPDRLSGSTTSSRGW